MNLRPCLVNPWLLTLLLVTLGPSVVVTVSPSDVLADEMWNFDRKLGLTAGEDGGLLDRSKSDVEAIGVYCDHFLQANTPMDKLIAINQKKYKPSPHSRRFQQTKALGKFLVKCCRRGVNVCPSNQIERFVNCIYTTADPAICTASTLVMSHLLILTLLLLHLLT